MKSFKEFRSKEEREKNEHSNTLRKTDNFASNFISRKFRDIRFDIKIRRTFHLRQIWINHPIFLIISMSD